MSNLLFLGSFGVGEIILILLLFLVFVWPFFALIRAAIRWLNRH